VRKVRSAHGTRVARRVVCASCGKTDIIDFAPRDVSTALCRDCAFQQLRFRDPDNPAHFAHTITCATCGRIAKVPFEPKDPSAVECPDCYRGIESKQENRSRRAQRLSKKVVRVRPSEDS
jgi:CxxC-x17-CxxC domain-containing protein